MFVSMKAPVRVQVNLVWLIAWVMRFDTGRFLSKQFGGMVRGKDYSNSKKENAIMDEPRAEIEKEMEKMVEKQVTDWAAVAITTIIQVAIMFVIALVLFKVVWAWVVPDLFPGAVDQGLIIADLTWLAAVKLAVLVGVLGGFSPALTDAFKQR